MESRKTTTISFRIDDELKNLLSNTAKKENKTITVKAKEALTEYLKLNTVRGYVKEVDVEIKKIDIDVMGKISRWKGAFDVEYIGIMENQKLLFDHHQKLRELTYQIESMMRKEEKKETPEPIKNERFGIKLFLFSVAIIVCNALITALIIKL